MYMIHVYMAFVQCDQEQHIGGLLATASGHIDQSFPLYNAWLSVATTTDGSSHARQLCLGL